MLLLRLLHMAQKVLLLLNLRKLFGHVALGEVLRQLLLEIVDSLLSQLASKGTLPTCVVGHSRARAWPLLLAVNILVAGSST